MSSYQRDPSPRPGDGIYRFIIGLFIADIVVGIGLVLFGELMLQQRAITYAGAGLAVIGLLLLLFFRAYGARRR